MEFAKRMDPSLPFCYHSSTDRFYEGELPTFDEPPEKPKKPKKAPRREQVGAGVGRRITMAARGTGSVEQHSTTFLWICLLLLLMVSVINRFHMTIHMLPVDLRHVSYFFTCV